MRPTPGQLADMITRAVADDSAVICHSTLWRNDADNAVCRRFYDRLPTRPLQVARLLGMVESGPVAVYEQDVRGHRGGDEPVTPPR